MDRINGADWVNIGGGKRGFRDQNAAAGLEGTALVALWLNDIQENLFKVIEDEGLAPAAGDWSLLQKALRRMTRGGRADLTINGFQSAPPGAPADNQIYIVQPTGTGAWAGRNNYIAQWSGGVWSFSLPLTGMIVNYWSGGTKILQFDGSQWVSLPGTVAEIEAATPNKIVMADQMRAARSPYFILSAGAATQSIPSNTNATLTNMASTISSFLSDPASTVTGSKFTVGAKDAGAWIFMGYTALVLGTVASGGTDFRLSVARNGSTGPFQGQPISAVNTYGNSITQPFTVTAGDVIELSVFHNTGAARNASSTQLAGFRIGGA
ncbi:DUF2793 domain-containing protein [Mesorhizobium sp. 2RAF21]|uniref:DUF2793 domain-containing protein n=1 Tax=Mesorhizobium sp. 2RAF21 TaxID=3232995 RepID=UPI003F96D297